MNAKSYNKLIKSIKSCRNEEQICQFLLWYNNLRELYHFSSKQKHEINEEVVRNLKNILTISEFLNE